MTITIDSIQKTLGDIYEISTTRDNNFRVQFRDIKSLNQRNGDEWLKIKRMADARQKLIDAGVPEDIIVMKLSSVGRDGKHISWPHFFVNTSRKNSSATEDPELRALRVRLEKAEIRAKLAALGEDVADISTAADISTDDDGDAPVEETDEAVL